MNPKYNLDKEKKQLVAVKPAPPKVEDYTSGDLTPDQMRDNYVKAVEEWHSSCRTLPPPIDYSPEFLAYSETTPGPYEEGVHFFKDYAKEFELDELGRPCHKLKAYPIQKAEPAPLPDNWNEYKKLFEDKRLLLGIDFLRSKGNCSDAFLNDHSNKIEIRAVLSIMWDYGFEVFSAVRPEKAAYKEKTAEQIIDNHPRLRVLKNFPDLYKEMVGVIHEAAEASSKPLPQLQRLKALLKLSLQGAFAERWTNLGPFDETAWNDFCQQHNIEAKSVEADKQTPELKTGTKEQFGKELMQWILPYPDAIPATLTECGTEDGSTRIILTLSEKDANTLSKYLYKEVKIVAP